MRRKPSFWLCCQGQDLYRQARGIDDSRVVVEREEKSLSQEVTFAEDISNQEVLRKLPF